MIQGIWLNLIVITSIICAGLTIKYSAEVIMNIPFNHFIKKQMKETKE